MTPGTPLASQATSDSFPISSPSFWQAAVQVDADAAAAAAVVSARPPKRSVHFSDEVPEKKARLESSLHRTGIPASSLDVNDFWASEDEEDAAGRRSEQAAKEYLMNAEYAPNKFGDIGDYMRKKEIKIQTQYRDLVTEGDSELKPIFNGLSFYINGNTDPPLEVLRKMILSRGGIIMPYLRKKTAVSHIIAPVLPPSKHVAFADYRVVKPGWIVASAEADALLDWRKWRLVPSGGELESAQKGLGSFLAKASQPPKSPKVRDEDKLPITSLPIPPRPPDPKVAGHDSIGSFQDETHLLEIPTKSSASETVPVRAASPASPSPRRAPKLADKGKKKEENPWANYFKFEENPDAQRLMKDEEWQKKNTAQAGNEFIEGYYQNSRLHHLSTWKAELRVLVSAAQQEAEIGPRPQLSNSIDDTLSLSTSVLPRVDSPARANLSKAEGKVIFHVDFDAFFVSCGLALRPELKGKPTVVCHSQGRQGAAGSTSEIASCSYEARAKGVKNGMSLGRARELCPDIITIPYEFETYKKFSLAFYTILMGYADDLEAVSVDEALIDATSAVRSRRLAPDEETDDALVLRRNSADEDPFHASPGNEDSLHSFRPRDWAVEVAQKIRDDVRAATGCEVSIGISHNILLAKLATRHAKPAGVHHLLPAAVPSFIAPLEVDDLPSIGYSTKLKIKDRFGTTNCGALLKQTRQSLKDVLGPKNGNNLFGYLRGEDDRKLEAHKERKSVSAEVNYGIRFQTQAQAESFLHNLSKEVSSRLKKLGTRGKMLTLKIMYRHPDAPSEAPKFMGHGVCETINKSSPISNRGGTATDDAGILGQESVKLLRSMALDPAELRGIGMQVVKLEGGTSAPAQSERARDQPALVFKAVKTPPAELPNNSGNGNGIAATTLLQEPSPFFVGPQASTSATSPASDDKLDSSFLEAMPPSIRKELEEAAAVRGSRSMSRAASEMPKATTVRPPKQPSRASTRSPAERRTSERNAAAHITKQLRPGVKSFLPAKTLAEQPLWKAARKMRAVTPIQEDDASVIDLTDTPSKRPREPKPKIGAYEVTYLKDLGIDLDWFAALPSDMQEEQVQYKRNEARRASAVQSKNAGRGHTRLAQYTLHDGARRLGSLSASVSPSRDRGRSSSVGLQAAPISVRRMAKPTLSKKETVSDIMDVVSKWVEAGRAEGPADRDVARVKKYLGKCLNVNEGGQSGLGDACTVLSWWKGLLTELWPERDSEVGCKWWTAWDRALEDANAVALQRFRAPLKL